MCGFPVSLYADLLHRPALSNRWFASGDEATEPCAHLSAPHSPLHFILPQQNPKTMTNVSPCAFKWDQFSDQYEVDSAGKKLTFKYMQQPATGPVPGSMYHTAVGSTAFEPNTGKHYWEFTTAQDNFKIGVALQDAPTNMEMGYNNKTWAVYIQTGECEHDRLERLKPEGVQRRLWRLVVPISGGRFGCLLDTKNGTLQLFFNGEYQGMAFDEASGIPFAFFFFLLC